MNGIFSDVFFAPLEFLLVSRLRGELLSKARGKTLEIGAGTGLNFSHYPESVEVTALDPDASMLRRAEVRARARPIRIVHGSAEDLPFESETFDTVVATLTFCSVSEPERALREAFRVLKPGGRLLLLEHIRKNGRFSGPFQDFVTPAWKKVSGGCHLNRQPELWIRQYSCTIESHQRLLRGFGESWSLIKRERNI